MIDQAILLLKSELQNYISGIDESVNVVTDNIGLLETSKGETLDNNIVITMVNIEEETTLKNQPALRRPFSGIATYRNPPVCLNLFILFTCNYFGNGYPFALKRLSYVIKFINTRSSFSISNRTEEITEVRFTMEMVKLSFEQVNHLWGTLGGRQIPFVLYKLSLVALSDAAVIRESPLIEEIETNLLHQTGN
ncbi:MAG: DUF4255 domain-containing protein [Chitinophagaceae bacterium]|nr:DUF4255 domain-containing protein [Chitinophagaceae bacterium]